MHKVGDETNEKLWQLLFQNFIVQGLDSSDSEGFSDDEDFEAELQAALLLSAEDQGGPPPPSEFSEDTRHSFFPFCYECLLR